MRWFFLAALLLVAGVGNLFGAIDFATSRILGIAYFNVFLLALLSLWWHAYFTADFERQKGMDRAMLVLLVLMGVFLVKIGLDAFITNDCTGLRTERRRFSISNLIEAAATQWHLCRPLALVGVAAGGWAILFAWRVLPRR